MRGDSVRYRFQVGTSPELTATLAILHPDSVQAPTDGIPVATFARVE